MLANPLLQVGLDLCKEILDIHPEVDIGDLKQHWNRVSFFYLRTSRQALEAVNIILPHGLVAPSEVLVRHMFELAVRLRYMEASPEDRVPQFLSHSNLADPTDSDINHQIQALQEQRNYAAASELMLLRRPWGNLRKMCEELELSDHYETVYRVSSEHAHGGGHGMALNLLDAYGLGRVPDWELPGILCTAITYHAWIIDVNLTAFPHLASAFSLNADWKDRMRAFEGDIESALRRGGHRAN